MYDFWRCCSQTVLCRLLLYTRQGNGPFNCVFGVCLARRISGSFWPILFIEDKGIINAIVVKGEAGNYSRKDLDKLTDYVKTYKAGGLAYLKYQDEVSGSIFKVLSEKEINDIKDKLNVEKDDLVLIVSGNRNIVKTSLGALRCKLARDLNLIKPGDYKLLWVVDFPSFEWSEEENRFMACHHPFTMPKDEDVDKLLTDKANCYSKAYDIVINGYEAGGGSIRIHDQDVQKKMFEALELTEKDIEEKFGFFVEALKYGCPPHGGFAIGLDRLTMLMLNIPTIKESMFLFRGPNRLNP